MGRSPCNQPICHSGPICRIGMRAVALSTLSNIRVRQRQFSAVDQAFIATCITRSPELTLRLAPLANARRHLVDRALRLICRRVCACQAMQFIADPQQGQHLCNSNQAVNQWVLRLGWA